MSPFCHPQWVILLESRLLLIKVSFKYYFKNKYYNIPIVVLKPSLKEELQNLWTKDVLPTPESPIKTILNILSGVAFNETFLEKSFF